MAKVNILDWHLHQVVDAIEASGDIDVVPLGIGFDVSCYYSAAATVATAQDLGTAMIALLEQVITSQRIDLASTNDAASVGSD